MKNSIVLLSIVFLGFILNACNDNSSTSDPVVKPKTKTDLLCQSNWIRSAITVQPGLNLGGGPLVTDIYSTLDSCRLDDFVKYNSDKSGIEDEGKTKCDPSDKQTKPFIWAFNEAETQLTHDGDVYDVVSITETTLIMKIVIDGGDLGQTKGDKYTFTSTFKH